jgi:F0F1-type ATP synthase delta subunit
MTIFARTRLILSAVCFSLFLLNSPSLVLADQAAPDRGNLDLVLKIWKANDDDLLLDNIKASLLNGDQTLLKGLSDKNADSIKKIVDDNFVDIKTAMLQYMAQNGRSTLLRQAYNWLVTPMGEKISQQHLFALMLFTDPEAKIPVKPPELSPERAELQKRFEKILFSDVNTFQTTTLEHFMSLQNQTRQPEQRLTDIQLDQQIKSASVNVSDVTSQVLPDVFNRLFTNLSLEEVTVVLNFLDSQGGRNYNDLLLDAYINAVKTTLPKALLAISKLFDDALAILSPYSKEKLSEAKQRELMALLIKQNGKPTIIRAMIDARAGLITINTKDGDTKEVYGRPNHELVSLDTLMTDLSKSGMDIRGFYKILQKQLHDNQ